jgi:threonine dehydrogenase-like Zn-dependent dehydrogenase
MNVLTLNQFKASVESGGVVGAVGVPSGNDYMLQQLIEMQKQNQIAIVNLQNTIIDLHQQKIEDVEHDEPENKLGSLGSIAGQLLSNPNIQEMLANKIVDTGPLLTDVISLADVPTKGFDRLISDKNVFKIAVNPAL